MAKGSMLRGANWRLWGGIVAGGDLIPLVPMIRRRASDNDFKQKDHRVVRGLITRDGEGSTETNEGNRSSE